MEDRPVIVVIPALDEEESLPHVLADLAAQPVPIHEVLVVDNGSQDGTPRVAAEAGATVLREPRRGYGAACLRALGHVARAPIVRAGRDPWIVFLDGDHSDHPEDLPALLAPLARGEARLVIGSRLRREDARAAVPLPSRLGNALACGVLRWLYGVRFTDLGPFRAIPWSALEGLGMEDRTWGWTLEMQIRACRAGLTTTEVPVRYRTRHGGASKISGSLVGGLRAAARILWVLGRHVLAAESARALRWQPR